MAAGRKLWWWLAGGLGVAGAIVIGLVFFAPKSATTADEMVQHGHAEPILIGQFSGADAAHEVSGTVTVYRSPKGAFMHFEGYDATDGPDVGLYLSPSPDGAFGDDAVRVRVPGGADDGHATVRGSFNVPIPDSLSPQDYRSAIIWCRRFGVSFGQAPLRPVDPPAPSM